MGLYRKKPVTIEAVQLTWANWDAVCDFVPVGQGKTRGVWVSPSGEAREEGRENAAIDKLGLHIETLEGVMLAREDDWIIKGVNGEFYPCKPDIFDKTYEPA